MGRCRCCGFQVDTQAAIRPTAGCLLFLPTIDIRIPKNIVLFVALKASPHLNPLIDNQVSCHKKLQFGRWISSCANFGLHT